MDTSIDKIILELWDNQETVIIANDGGECRITFSRPDDFFDIVIFNKLEPMGFITLKYESNGLYSIVNDTSANFHPSFINTPGHGIEVKTKFRKRGLGKALLSIGIGMVQKDWQVNPKDGRFKVTASDITKVGLGCYKNFGFTIKEGMAVSSCDYTDPENVPEINILPRKASFLTRLQKRLFRNK